jgi:hypothetical protein
MAAKKGKEHKENRIHEMTYSRHLHRKDELKSRVRAAPSGFLCDLCVLLWLNQLPELG